MIDFHVDTQPPTTGIPAFGTNPRVATSTGFQFAQAHEIAVSVDLQIERRSQIRSVVSSDHGLVQTGMGVEALVDEGILDRELAQIARYPDEPGRYVSVAAIQLALGRIEDAIALLQRIADRTNDYWVHHYLALAFARDGRRPEAKKMLHVLIESSPKDVRPLHALGRMLIEERDWSAALSILERAIALDPFDALVFSDAAAVALQIRDHKRAIRWLRRALDRDPASAVALNNLGVAYHMQGNLVRAQRYFSEAYAVDARCAPAVHNLAEGYMTASKFEETVHLLSSHLRSEPSDLHAKERLAWAHYSLGQVSTAIRVMQELVGKSPADGPVLNNLAMFFGAKKDWDRATEYFRRAIALAGGNVQIRINFAQLLAALGRWREVPEKLHPEHVSGDLDAVWLLANAYLRSDEPEAAANLLTAHTEDFPRDARLPAMLGYLLSCRLGRAEEAVSILEESLRHHPSDALLVNNLAYALVKLNRVSEARDILEPWLAENEMPEGDLGKCILASRGLIRLRGGSFEEGMDFYRQAKAGASGELKQRLKQKMLLEEGRHHMETGQVGRAIAILRQAIASASDPEFTDEARMLLTSAAGKN
jgi:tetratricopeptide (TPR) repeat protein